VAIIREVNFKGWVYRDITKVGEQMRRRKILSFNNVVVFLMLQPIVVVLSQPGSGL
jgi:hypothetical protein